MSDTTPVATIFAVSTGVGRSAIAIVRVSGPAVGEILLRICGRTAFHDRVATLATLFDPEGNTLDRAIVIKFASPRSFTGEDMVEFQVTGGKAVIAGLVRALSACSGTRPAEAGEFAMRAFENGKLDLAEIEGLAAVVEAETQAQLRQAVTMASGALSRQSERARELLLDAAAQMESLLDFSDVEDASGLGTLDILIPVREAEVILRQMLEGSAVSERLRDGMTVVLAGAPNVGKSTLINHLAKREVAIVSSMPGTTRDVLEVAADVAGFPVTFIDTAGIRATTDPVETEGVARARQRGERADLVLWLSEDEKPFLPPEARNWRVLPVNTKADLTLIASSSPTRLAISAVTGQGIDRLLAKVAEYASAHFEGVGRVSVGTERQISAARETLEALEQIVLHPHRPLELIAEDLRRAIQALGRIAGRIGVEEVLGEIFSRLCVGK